MKYATVLVGLYKAGLFLPTKLESLRQLSNFNDCDIILLNCQNLNHERDIYQDFLLLPNVYEIFYNDYVKLYSSWNDGIKSRQSKYIINSNVDDMMHPDCIVRLGEVLDKSDHAIVSSQVLITDTPNQLWPNWDHVDRMPLYPYPYSSAGPSPLWRSALHDKYGYFDDYYVIGDARIWEKWYAGGEAFNLYPEDLVLYYRSPTSLERRFDGDVTLRDLDLTSP